jgi:hypothetical protein
MNFIGNLFSGNQEHESAARLGSAHGAEAASMTLAGRPAPANLDEYARQAALDNMPRASLAALEVYYKAFMASYQKQMEAGERISGKPDPSDLAALYGPEARYSEHQRGQTITFFDSASQQIVTGKIVWVKAAAPAYEGGPVRPLTYMVDTGAGFPAMVYPSDVTRVIS